MNFLQKLFSSKDKPAEPQTSTTASTMVEAQSTLPRQLPPGFHVGKKTDIGQVRDKNQDSFFTFTSHLEGNDQSDLFGIFIVADGMGGYQKGEIASEVAVRTASDYLLKHIYLPYLAHDEYHAAQTPINEVLTAAVITANNSVLETAPEAGTTLTIALVMGHYAYLAHVGDSRAYLFHHNQLRQITKDHSLVARLVELGQATPEEAITHPQRNVLYRAIGQTGALEVETYLQDLAPGSAMLLCSDGLWSMVQDDEITRILSSAATPQDAADNLVEFANIKGGDDNITAVFVGIG